MDYSQLTKVYEKLESSPKRLDKTWYVAELLQKTKDEDIGKITLLLQGRIYPSYDERKIGVASRLVLKAINVASGISADKIESDWKKTGDLGETACNLIGKKKQATLFSAKLTVKKVFDNLQNLADLEGAGAVYRKVKLIAELLTSAEPVEAKYIVRTVLEDLRVGVGEGVLRDAIVWAFFPKVMGVFFYCNSCRKYVPNTANCLSCREKLDTKDEQSTKGFKVLEVGDFDSIRNVDSDLIASNDPRVLYNHLIESVQEALDVTNDYGKVALLAKKGLSCLKKVNVEAFTPIKVMLYQKAKGFEDAFERVGKPAAFEYKYDGFRLNIHKSKDKVKLFTRRLEEVTAQFPDIVEEIKQSIHAKDYILDAEVIGVDPKTGKWLQFQQISQRIKRKHDIGEMAKKVPVIVNLFDVIQVDGKNVLKTPFKERRAILEKITKQTDKIKLAEQLVTSDISIAQSFYDKALRLGNEGVMAKNLKAPYKPGSRVGYGVKIKPIMETLDLVIIGAEWGEGKRAKWLSSFIVACKDNSGNLLELGKVSTGLKEKPEEGISFDKLTKLLKQSIINENGKVVFVKPKIVVEVDYEEIQKSPKYSSGFALRFPRVVGLRQDKPVSEISTLDIVEELYFSQN